MKYMGSKNRIAKDILPIILQNRKPGQWYVEPFCGGCNVIDKVDGNRMANDLHFYLIELFKALQNGWLPPENVDEVLYWEMKANKDNYPPELVGYVGFQLSYGGKWFRGYRRDKVGIRNYASEAYKNMVAQIEGLKDILFSNVTYQSLIIPDNSIIYCDPPYFGTEKYKDGFSPDEFWNWCSSLTERGHIVFVSEYAAPDGWACVWEKPMNCMMSRDMGAKQIVEKLFTFTG